jgi:hypothetical protein
MPSAITESGEFFRVGLWNEVVGAGVAPDFGHQLDAGTGMVLPLLIGFRRLRIQYQPVKAIDVCGVGLDGAGRAAAKI